LAASADAETPCNGTIKAIRTASTIVAVLVDRFGMPLS
jgi:hypothetical protein